MDHRGPGPPGWERGWRYILGREVQGSVGWAGPREDTGLAVSGPLIE